MEAPARGARVAFLLGPLMAGVAFLCAGLDALPEGFSPAALRVAGVTVWMALWWVWEPIPIAATSMLPMVLYPLLGVAPVKEVVTPYMSPFIVLLMAGFMAALAIERWGLHRRVALRILLAVGASPARLVLGMMVAASVCSMFISNTATTLMMLPIGMALVTRAEEMGGDASAVKRFSLVLFLGLAYSASVGGLGTPIGTPPNLIFMGAYETSFPERPPITFVDWMSFGIPTVALLVPAIWAYLVFLVGRFPRSLPMGGKELLLGEHRKLGPVTRDEWKVGIVFSLMALAWVTRQLKLADGSLIGWAPALGVQDYVDDSTIAVVGALALFALPASTRPGERILDWDTAKRIPWNMLLLFGGGLALAKGFKESGLDEAIVDQLQVLAELPAPILILCIALLITFLTEVTSNTATATVMMPLLASFSVAAGLEPTQVMVPAVLSASCAFMLPVATAPNAIVYGTGRVGIRSMARTGVAINFGGAVLITLLTLIFF